eukprot:TRINITY_DN22091_c0_g1_i1.p1 TRINITY_DN22091_c0_g1~~TRINITY_DN22091_c0_g1_i1.p1  ORF type:complete len:1181 (+),score=181.17 TRINITY_DN22091_c0_g1_i1:54-3596(+)
MAMPSNRSEFDFGAGASSHDWKRILQRLSALELQLDMACVASSPKPLLVRIRALETALLGSESSGGLSNLCFRLSQLESVACCNLEEEIKNINKVDYTGDNVAVAAYHCSFRRLVDLVKHGADVNMADNSDVGYGATALDFLATVPTYVTDVEPKLAAKVMQWLISQRADVNKQDYGGKTPLHFFGKFGGGMEQLQVLLDNDININLGMNYGDHWTPLWYVRNYRTPIWRQVERELLRRGARQLPGELDHQMPREWTRDCIEQSSTSNYEGKNVSEAAANGAFGDLCRLVESRGDVNETWPAQSNRHGALTALHYVAAAEGLLRSVEPCAATRVIEWLLTHKAEVNKTDEYGATALHLCARYCAGHMESLTALLQARADVNRVMLDESRKETPLAYSRRHNTQAAAKVTDLLLEWGAEAEDILTPEDGITDRSRPTQCSVVPLSDAFDRVFSRTDTLKCHDLDDFDGKTRNASSLRVAELLRCVDPHLSVLPPHPSADFRSCSQKTVQPTDIDHISKLKQEFPHCHCIDRTACRAITLRQLRLIVSFARKNCHEWHVMSSDAERNGQSLTMSDASFVGVLPREACSILLEETYAEWGGITFPCIHSEGDSLRIVRIKRKGVFGQLNAHIAGLNEESDMSVHAGDRIVSVNGKRADASEMMEEMKKTRADGIDVIEIEISRGGGNMNLYHANDWIIKPATAAARCSMVELLADHEQIPTWFISHWWGETISSFVRCVARHEQVRALPDTAAYWVCAYANRQHDLGEALTDDPLESSFYLAMKESVGLLLLLDEEKTDSFGAVTGPATPLTRIWCCFEEYMALNEEFNKGRKSAMLVDIASCQDQFVAVLTDGVAPIDGVGYQSDTNKTRRESGFPFNVLRRGLTMSIEDARATQEEDRRRILNLVAKKPLDDPCVRNHENYNRVNKWIRANTAVFLWMPAVIHRTLDNWGLPAAIAEDTQRRKLAMSFQGNRKIGDEVLDALGRALPTGLKILSLNFCSCLCITDEGIKRLAMCFPKGLQQLKIDFGAVQNITPKGAAELSAGLGRIDELNTLKLWFDECRQVDDSFIKELSSQLPATVRNLQLKFYFGGFGDAGLSDFGKNLPSKLEFLKFDAVAVNRVSDRGARSFVRSLPESLERIEFDFNGTRTDPQFRLIAKSNNLEQLRSWAIAGDTADYMASLR